MSISQRTRILNYFYRSEFSDQVLSFDDELVPAVQTVLNKSLQDAEQFVHARAKALWNDCIRLADEDRALGLEPWLIPVDLYMRRFRWAPFAYIKSLEKKKVNCGLLLKGRPRILRQIDTMTNREYEALSCIVAKLAGGVEWELTPPGNEGGIDSVIKLSTYSKSHLFGGVHAPVRVIVQCKKYTEPVDVGRVDQFITTLENVRKRSSRVDGILPAWFHNEKGPIIGLIVAHSGFQSGAQSEAKKHGIVLSTSRDLTEIITLCRTFHSHEAPDTRALKLKQEVEALLQ